MGSFMAVSAFRNADPSTLAEALVAAAESFGTSAEVLPGQPADEASQAAIFAPVDAWTVVMWPEGFNLHDIDTCAALTSTLRTVASTVHIYDDDYWTHAAVAQGEVRDVFCSMPNYFDDEPDLAEKYAGHPAVVAEVCGGDASVVAAYLRPADEVDDEPALEGDEFALDDFWVFTDLWRRLGITYPDDLDAPAVVVDLGEDWTQNFPEGASEL